LRFSTATDADAAGERGIVVTSTGYFSEATVELTWALIHASIRDVAAESSSVRAGGWQRSVGADLAGQVLGVLGLGNIGSRVAVVGTAFGMKVIAWSENLTRDQAPGVHGSVCEGPASENLHKLGYWRPLLHCILNVCTTFKTRHRAEERSILLPQVN
jgi:lactate dehydrogenase-like 2-hydroxyacid dehydrogenase